MTAKKLLGSGESWRKQACSLTQRQLAWASVMPQLSPLLSPLWQGQASQPRPLGLFQVQSALCIGLC